MPNVALGLGLGLGLALTQLFGIPLSVSLSVLFSSFAYNACASPLPSMETVLHSLKCSVEKDWKDLSEDFIVQS